MATVTRTRQATNPNIALGARAGYCLQYCDDGISAPARQARAIYSYNVEKRNGNIRTGNLPVGVRVPGFLNFTKGAYVDYGHVFWIVLNADGSVQIDDSEVHSGHRGVYHSLAELLRWFGAYAPQYLGYSLWLDGRQVAEEYQEQVPEPAPTPPTPVGDTHTVVQDETLGQIILDEGWNTDAGLWGENGDVDRIARANNIADPNLIHPGDVIKRA
jgi:hypothetical protein